MKLLLTITLFTNLIFASNIKEVNIFGLIAYFGTNHDIAQEGRTPKNKNITLDFLKNSYINGEYLDSPILDQKNKRAWKIKARPSDDPTFRNCSLSTEVALNTENIKEMDLNLLRFLIKSKPDKNKKLYIWVENKKGGNTITDFYKIFSLTENKYLNGHSHEAYFVCQSNRYYKPHIETLKFRQKKYKEQNLQKKINIKKRKTIQVADDTDQGMILQIKGPLVLIQKKTCTIMNEYGVCLDYGKTSEWVKRKDLTFKNQK